ncbi:hypothetical protein B0T49_21795 [Chromobacterium violaceum]|uniref:hypothetical protein n=1 Tax=Chromobacterium violaceum TaxID=536 RepID=UPI0009D9A2E8|nr:hypothetical protein [Chromobacterium violaceum]OQS45191.1 hypothetical protein B0T49_21795 [Chromobacterium violaceum]OQS45779.1 hypothetical protein B0T48_17985 [Chromobacterium violaceum]
MGVYFVFYENDCGRERSIKVTAHSADEAAEEAIFQLEDSDLSEGVVVKYKVTGTIFCGEHCSFADAEEFFSYACQFNIDY